MGRTTETPRDEAPTHARAAALAWLRHPASLASIGVLLLNDHVLKAAFGAWWTGKLSDVAGLVFAPALLAVVAALLAPRARPRALAAATIATTGTAFAVVKATTAGAAAASATLSALAGPSVVRPDATDLLALPALGVAWLTFRATRPAGPPLPAGRRVASRLATVATLVVATGAVLATSSRPPARVVAVDVHGTNGVVTVTYYDFFRFGAASRSVLETTDGVSWSVRCGEASAEECTEDHQDYDQPDFAPVCVPSRPDVCFRPQEDAIAVDRSDDGGATWHREWGLTETERERLDEVLGVQGFDEYLRTMGVRILDGPGGFVVIAADGVDGLAVRHPDGTWERRGLLDSRCCSGLAYPPIDVSEEPPFDLGTSVGAASALAAWCLAFAIAVFGTRSPQGAPVSAGGRVLHGAREAMGCALAAVGVAGVACAVAYSSWLAYAGSHPTPDNPDSTLFSETFALEVAATVFGGIGIAGLVAILVSSFVFPTYFRRNARLVGASVVAAAVATPVALAVGWTAHRVWMVIAATAVAFAVGLTATYLLARLRRVRRASPPGPDDSARPVTFEP
jgi:hypothetical protein